MAGFFNKSFNYLPIVRQVIVTHATNKFEQFET